MSMYLRIKYLFITSDTDGITYTENIYTCINVQDLHVTSNLVLLIYSVPFLIIIISIPEQSHMVLEEFHQSIVITRCPDVQPSGTAARYKFVTGLGVTAFVYHALMLL